MGGPDAYQQDQHAAKKDRNNLGIDRSPPMTQIEAGL